MSVGNVRVPVLKTKEFYCPQDFGERGLFQVKAIIFLSIKI